MKQILSLIAGTVFVLALGMAYADELLPGSEYPSDKMIRNDDLLKYDQDQGPGPINQMPALPEVQGSAAGGVSGDDTYDKPSPVEHDKTKPSESGGDIGGPSQDRGIYGY